MRKVTDALKEELKEKRDRQEELIKEKDEVIENMKKIRNSIPPEMRAIMHSSSSIARGKRSDDQAVLDFEGALAIEKMRQIDLENELEKIEKEIEALEELAK